MANQKLNNVKRSVDELVSSLDYDFVKCVNALADVIEHCSTHVEEMAVEAGVDIGDIEKPLRLPENITVGPAKIEFGGGSKA